MRVCVRESDAALSVHRALTFQGMEEVVNGVLIQWKSLLIFLLIVSLSSLLDQFYRFLGGR